MKRRMAKILACLMAVMLMASGMPEGSLLRMENLQKSHTAYAAVTGYITSYNDLVEATATGGVYVLSNSIVLTKKVIIPEGVDLTLLQERGGNNKITSVNLSTGFISVEEEASLTLGSKDTEPLVVDGSNLEQGVDLFHVYGTLTIENADLSCPNGYGVWVDGKLNMNDGYIHDCLLGILIYNEAEGVIAGGNIADCKGTGVGVCTNASCKMTGGIISNVSCGISCGGACTMTGGLVTGCDIGVCTNALLKDASKVSFTMNGGAVSNSKTYALYPEGGAIYLIGGSIRNGRCTTYSKGSFYIGGSPYLDDSSFILVREGAPLLQMGNLSVPATNPYAKIDVYGLTTEQPLITAVSEDISLLDSWALYQPYDRDFSLSVKDNQIYMEGNKEIDTKVYPTVRPGISDTTEQPSTSTGGETIVPTATEIPVITEVVSATEIPVITEAVSATEIPVITETVSATEIPVTTETVSATEAPVIIETPSVATVPSITAIPPTASISLLASDAPITTGEPLAETPTVTSGENTQEPALGPMATQSVYEEFYSCRPEITKISAKGLNFQLQWKFSSAVPAKEYAIYCSSDQKNYSLIKTVDATITTISVSVSKAYSGKKIYFYVVARTTDAVSGNLYQSEKSYVASKYLINKVTGTMGSYHTNTQKLVVKWKKVSNCTGYKVYVKARCNGKTMTKRCATVSKTKSSVSISTRKIKRMFSSNGKPIHIKKYSVRAFYKSGKKTAYSPS